MVYWNLIVSHLAVDSMHIHSQFIENHTCVLNRFYRTLTSFPPLFAWVWYPLPRMLYNVGAISTSSLLHIMLHKSFHSFCIISGYLYYDYTLQPSLNLSDQQIFLNAIPTRLWHGSYTNNKYIISKSTPIYNKLTMYSFWAEESMSDQIFPITAQSMQIFIDVNPA